MPTTIPETHRDLLEKPICATLSTIMPDGQPQLTVVWFKFDGSTINVGTLGGSRKEKNMRARPSVALAIIDPSNPYRYIEVRGQVEEITEEGAMEHLDAVTMAYIGQPKFYGTVVPAELEGKETRVVCKIRPTRVSTYG